MKSIRMWRYEIQRAQEYLEFLKKSRDEKLKELFGCPRTGLTIPMRRVAKNGVASLLIVPIPSGVRLRTPNATKVSVLGARVIGLDDLPCYYQRRDSVSSAYKDSPVKMEIKRLTQMRHDLREQAKEAMDRYVDLAYQRRRELYLDYLNSNAWQKKRDEALSFYGSECQRCSSIATQIHHRTYDNLGNEPMRDLEPLCAPCHALEHAVIPSE